MESLDLRVLKDALLWYQSGHGVTLVTVVQTWGSAPRQLGALLALRDDGLVSGSVSGGCVEDDLIAQSQTQSLPLSKIPTLNPSKAAFSDSKPSLLTYGVDAAQARSFGIPCGGTLRLLKEPLQDSAWLEELLTRTQNHELVERELHVRTGAVRLHPAQRGQGVQFDGETLRCVFGPQWRLCIIGAGQLSLAVAQIAQMMDFEVLVCDPRDEYAATASWAGWVWLKGMPDDEVQALVPDAHTAIVALSHDPKLDDLALIEALRSKAFYVGALGSRRSQAARKQRLAEHFGLSEQELARLHGPVGLAIAAKTPAEIAVSIMAEIIQLKNAVAEVSLI